MAKTKISEFSSTPANNTDIDSINIAEGCAPSGINDAIRELMAQLKDFQTGAQGDSFNGPIGTSTAAAGAFTTLSATGAITSTLATGTAPLVIASTTKVSNLNVDLLDGADWASPAALGSTTPAAVSATTLSASSTVTLSGGTANGVAYLNGSKVVTSGSALTFDGTNFGLGISSPYSGSRADIQIATSTANYAFQARTFDAGTSDGSTTAKVFRAVNNGGGNWANAQYDAWSHIWTQAGSEGMRLTSTGLGIGTSSPAYKFDLSTNTEVVGRFARSSGSNALFLIQDSTTTTAPYIASYGNAMAFGTYGGTEFARFSSTGNLGLGVTPSAWGSGFSAFQIGKSGAVRSHKSINLSALSSNTYDNGTNPVYSFNDYATLYQQYLGQHQWYNAPSGTAGNAITFTQAMTLDASGNLGVGTTSPSARVHVVGGSAGNLNAPAVYIQNSRFLTFQNAAGSGWGMGIYADSSDNGWIGAVNNLTFNTGSGATERARIDSSGNLLLGATSQFNVGKQCIAFNGNTNYGISLKDTVDQATARFIGFINGSGTVIGSVDRVTTTNAVIYNTTSDYRLKTVTGAVTGQGARIDALNPIDYLWKDDGQQARGFLAHEFQTVYPNSVTGEKDAVDEQGNPVYQAMQASTAEVIADLVAEIQSLRKRLANAGL